MEYGIWTLVPILVVLLFALRTKRTLEPLILGTAVAYIIICGIRFPLGWMEAFFNVATDRDHQWVFMVCALFGSLITLLVAWIMGILIFVDDYLNIMTLCTCMRKLTDKHKVPRETLSYIIDSTGAPVCAILPFSTWAIFFSGLFFAEAGVPELGFESAIDTFVHVIPYTFYAIAAVIIVPLFTFGMLPKLGRMKKSLSAGRTDRKGIFT